ncbi:MepB family protein [Leuconostoc mesenteroides]|uniref:MepB family protein n=1 Tax=Leuconostoc mesenteroides TaxID=1245 RepID=UPI0021A9753F|nr:MepB family protein [Leuconostoc mesenteroides]MCT3046360.1 MepB protein [Leuconostoc mesenteroides]
MESLNLIEGVVARMYQCDVTRVSEESQNNEYEGTTLFVGNKSLRTRLAKKTPTKQGYFVVLWEKDDRGQNKPFDAYNSPELLVVCVIDNQQKGVFIFPKVLLVQQKILSSQQTKGKMAFRVYPDWVVELNKTAQRTQTWQKNYFVDLSTDQVDEDRFKRLLSKSNC